MKIYFAGADDFNEVNDLLLKNGCENRLASAYYLNYKKVLDDLKLFKSLFVDSGGYTLIKNLKKIPVTIYADFINRNEIKCAFNLDVFDVEETLRNQKFLEKNTKSYIIPVYHYTDFLSNKYKKLIISYAKEYPLIAVAPGELREKEDRLIEFYDFIF